MQHATILQRDGTAAARRLMVDCQLRPNKVTDPQLISAMLEVPREVFLPPALAARAYADEDVALPGGRVLMAPMPLARMLQLLGLRDGDRLLLLGAGSGYVACLAARMGAQVVAVEDDAALSGSLLRNLAGRVPAGAVKLVKGAPAAGHAAAGPYDRILIQGAVPAVPEAVAAQLVEGGRLVTVLADAARGGTPRAVLGRRIGGSLSLADAFDCATRTLPAFAPAPVFVF